MDKKSSQADSSNFNYLISSIDSIIFDIDIYASMIESMIRESDDSHKDVLSLAVKKIDEASISLKTAKELLQTINQ